MSVTLIKRSKYDNPVRTAIEFCNGFSSLKPDHKVLIKPNLVMGANRKIMPPFGKVTTARVVEELIQTLVEYNCRDISIGEGAALMPELGSDTLSAMKFSGVERVGKKYGVKLIDFEQSEYTKVKINGQPFKIAASALDADFLINVPVLKTHGQAIVSLGMKNLKGCLKFTSKKRFHKQGRLLDLIAQLNTQIKSNLIIIDGIFAMDRGPTMGTAHPMDLIIAGTDILETEMVGAAVLGKDPTQIPHILSYGKLTGRQIDLGSVEIKGESIDSVAMDLPWESDNNESFKNFGLSGIQVSGKPGDVSICSGCLGNMLFANFMFAKDNPGVHVDELEICIGKNSKATPEAKKVILFGDCAIKNNREDARAIPLPGCPPGVGKYLPLLMNKSLPRGRAIRLLSTRLIKNTAFKMGLYAENFGLWDPYQPPKFDRSYYECKGVQHPS
jgi:uncharacterized protein (DUF362 family)